MPRDVRLTVGSGAAPVGGALTVSRIDPVGVHDTVTATMTRGGQTQRSIRAALVPETYFPDETTTGFFDDMLVDGVWQGPEIGGGSSYSPVSGQTINDTMFTTRLNIGQPDITLNNCWLRGHPTEAGDCITATGSLVRRAVLNDCTIQPQSPQWMRAAIRGHDYTLNRSTYIHCIDGLCHSNGAGYGSGVDQAIVMRACYVPPRMAYISPDPGAAGGLGDNSGHVDLMQFQGGYGFTIVGNTLLAFVERGTEDNGLVGCGGEMLRSIASPGPGSISLKVYGNKYATVSDPALQATSVAMFSPKLANAGNVLFRKNLMDGAAVMINWGDHDGSVAEGLIQFLNNTYGRNQRGNSTWNPALDPGQNGLPGGYVENLGNPAKVHTSQHPAITSTGNVHLNGSAANQ